MFLLELLAKVFFIGTLVIGVSVVPVLSLYDYIITKRCK